MKCKAEEEIAWDSRQVIDIFAIDNRHTQLELEEGAYCFYSAAAIISIGVASTAAMMPSSLFPLKRLSQFSTFTQSAPI